MTGVIVDDLRVDLVDGTPVVEHVSFALEPGKALGIVGESGSGKTTVAMALLAFARPGSAIRHGRILVGEIDILSMDERALRTVRGAQISFVPQDPASSLNPAKRIGRQVEEMLFKHLRDRAERKSRVLDSLRSVQLDPPEAFIDRYPHQLSGGQQQRVAVAMAFVCRPTVMVLDEPTTGLDVTTQARVLALIDQLRRDTGISLLYVSHDLGVVAHLTDEVLVMYGGRVVEAGPTSAVFTAALHPYTRKLLAAMPRSDVSGLSPRGIAGVAVTPSDRSPGCPFAPRCDLRVEVCGESFPAVDYVDEAHGVACFRWTLAQGLLPEMSPAARPPARVGTAIRLAVDGVEAGYSGRGHGRAAVLSGVSLQVAEGECVAVVGESGSGKTTLVRCVIGIHAPSSGTIALDGVALSRRARDRSSDQRQRIQVVFQNPDESLNPRHTVLRIVQRPVEQFGHFAGHEARSRAIDALDLVRLDSGIVERYPHELSGGEKQRVAIARALVARPTLLICDEITSALDVSVQAAILELLNELRASLEMSVLFVSHDLAVVRAIADQIVVVEQGRVCETGPPERIFETPSSSYTRALIDAQQSWSLETAAATRRASDTGNVGRLSLQ